MKRKDFTARKGRILIENLNWTYLQILVVLDVVFGMFEVLINAVIAISH
jgi:hypothetical protein